MANQLILNPISSKPFSRGFHFAGEGSSQLEPESHNHTDTWKDRKSAEHGDTDEDIRLHEFMEDIKRYIRSIDVSDL